MIPSTSVGAQLQRIVIGSALPVVGAGAELVAISSEARQVRTEARQAVESKAREPVPFVGDRVTKHIFYNMRNLLAIPAAGSEEVIPLVFAPGDGFITELIFMSVVAGTTWFMAIRTSSGNSVFLHGLADPVPPFDILDPDFMNPLTFSGSTNNAPYVSKVRIPVRSGEEIFAVMRMLGPGVAGINRVEAAFGFEFADISGVKELVLSKSAIEINLQIRSRALLVASENQAKLEVEREKTKRAQLEADARVAVASLAASAREAQPAGPISNPFQQLLLSEAFIAREQAAAAAIRAPRVPPPPPKPPPGDGLTFVRSWQPTVNGVGYLVPNPPRGGKVNVWDGRYSVFDGGGKLTSQGPVIMVRSDQEIPPGARISL